MDTGLASPFIADSRLGLSLCATELPQHGWRLACALPQSATFAAGGISVHCNGHGKAERASIPSEVFTWS